MMYAVAHQYLLSRDLTTFQSLLPQTLRALDYCLAQLASAENDPSPGKGLPKEPLNDLTSAERA
jgi:hypothetical protein